MIQFKRLTSESTTNIDDVTLKSGQPAIDLKDKVLYIGSTETTDASTSKLKFYDGDHVDNKLVNKVTVKKSNTESYIYPTDGNITLIQGSNVTLTSDTTNKTVTIASSYTDTNQKVKAKNASGTYTTFGDNDIVEIAAGSNVTVTPNATDKKITISSSYTNTSHYHQAGVGLVGSGSDYTTSGIYTYKAALKDETKDINAAVSRPLANADRTYPVIADKDGKLATIVPWIDTQYTLPAATSSTRGGAMYDSDYGVYAASNNGSFYVSKLYDDTSSLSYAMVTASHNVPTVSGYSSSRSLYPNAQSVDLGSSKNPYSSLYIQNDVYFVSNWGAGTSSTAGITSLNNKLQSIDNRLDKFNNRLNSLGFNGGQSVKVSGIGSSDFTLTIYKQGNVVWCNQDLSSVMFVYNKRKSTTTLPANLRPSTNTSGAILGYNVKSGPYTAGYSSQITIDTDGFITLEVNNDISVGGSTSTSYFMNYICFAYKLS